MSVKDRLQIILITYNRQEHVKKTFEQFFYEGSPVADCDFLVQDNNSTDNTREIVEEFSKTHPNVKYVKNKYNLGISGTIARAMERADKDYVWILGDDDIYDFSNWNEVEKAINNNEKMICVARYALPDETKNSVVHQLLQLTFITGGIYKTELFNDTTIRNAYDNIYTLFPHISPIIALINNGGKIYVVDKAISDNGMDIETTDVSYTRGIKKTSELYDRTRYMSWILGWANIISLLKDKSLQNECMEVAIPNKYIYGSWERFYKIIHKQYIKSNYLNFFLDIYKVLSPKRRSKFKIKKYLHKLDSEETTLEHVLQNIFSVKKEDEHKVIRILGVKIKIHQKRYKKNM